MTMKEEEDDDDAVGEGCDRCAIEGVGYRRSLSPRVGVASRVEGEEDDDDDGGDVCARAR